MTQQKTYDEHVPAELKTTQEWFASIITRPLIENSKMIETSPCGFSMEQEAPRYIAPSHTMKPHKRIELYNQQYWWRLLSVMQEIYPLVTRLFGYYNFNEQIAIPYLQKYHPNTWSLNDIGNRLPQWVEEEYKESDKQLILDSAHLDLAFNRAFAIKQLPPFDITQLPNPKDLSSLLDKTLYLQPHIHLFNFNYDLFEFRKKFIKEDGDYWINHDFPPLEKKKKYYFVLYRTRNNNIGWNEISAGEQFLLSLFQNGISIENACDLLEKAGDEIYQEAIKNLHKWFQEWIIRGWLSLA